MLTSSKRSSVLVIILEQCLESLLDIVFPDTIHRSMIDEKSNERVQVNSVHMLSSFSEIAELDLVLHVIDLLLSRVVAHCSHEVWQFIQGHCAVQLSSFSGVLIFTSDHRVIEKVFHVLEGLTVSTTLNQVYKWLDSLSS
jgi:hypothetical protein